MVMLNKLYEIFKEMIHGMHKTESTMILSKPMNIPTLEGKTVVHFTKTYINTSDMMCKCFRNKIEGGIRRKWLGQNKNKHS